MKSERKIDMVRDERNLEGKTCIFDTHGMDFEWENHDGKSVW